MKKIVLFTIFVIALIGSGRSQTMGTLDNTFGNGGIALTNMIQGASDDFGRAMAQQPDGKIVVAGVSFVGQTPNISVCRYNINGTLDNTFSGDGIETTLFGQTPASIMGVAVQSNGGILACGTLSNNFLLVRYTSSGALDNSFGTNGFVLTSLSANAHNANAIAIQSDGKIVLAGNTVLTQSQSYDFALVRYNSNGSLDNSFGTNGIVTAAASYNDVINAIAIQSDGKIVVAGYTLPPSLPLLRQFAVARFNTNGTLDGSFGAAGIVSVTPVTGTNNVATAVAVQPDGKIVLAGHSYNSMGSDVAIVRLDANGNADNSFGVGGYAFASSSSSSPDFAYSLLIQPDGNIVVSGTNGDFMMSRFTPSGMLDNNFGTNGILTQAIGSAGDDIRASLLQPDGKLVVAGSSLNGQNLYDFTVARYYVSCVPVSAPVTITGGTIICPGTRVYSVAPVASAISYSWNLPNGWAGNSTSNAITVTVQAAASGTIKVASVNSCNTSSLTALTVTVSNCTEVYENYFDSDEIILFPNPTNGIIYFKTQRSSPFSFSVVNLLGVTVKEGTLLETHELNLSDLEKGHYFITFKNPANSRNIRKQIILAE